MRQEYHKLVRDRIPEIIRQAGLNCEIVTLSAAEYRHALQDKLLEEAQEAVEASEESLVTELADLLDVIDALMETSGISQESVLLERDQKRAEKGGFTQKVKLLWTESPEL